MLAFTKLEGCGNDFLVVDLRGPNPARAHATLDGAAARALCDRRYGVGGDGVLVLLPPGTPGALARMRVLNADGSEAEMCGNGIRCVAKYLYERFPEARGGELLLDTGAGPLRCGVTVDGTRHVTHVTVAMGRPRLAPAEIPLALPGLSSARVVNHEIELAGQRFHYTAVSMGNPHAVVFVDGDEPLQSLAERYGPSLERHPWFPKRTNAEFARVTGPRTIDLVVWERGCGITLACGTGACATAVAAGLTERARLGDELAVRLPGGTLHVTVATALDGVSMRGPADEVYEGEIDLGGLLRRQGGATPGVQQPNGPQPRG